MRLVDHLLMLVPHNFGLELVDGGVLFSHRVVSLHDASYVGKLLSVHLLLHQELLLPEPLILEILPDDVGHA